MARWLTASPEETGALGAELGQTLKAPTVVALYGELGGGKTTFAKGLIASLAGIPERSVTSPTFTYLQVYAEGVAHFDLYRLKGAEEFTRRGFEEYLEEGIVVIEWAERIEALLPPHTKRLTFRHIELERRAIELHTV